MGFAVSSLNACAASNHRCRVIGLEPDISKVNDFASIRHKMYKIFTVLAASTSASSLLNKNILQGVPTTLMPLVLKMAVGFYHDDSTLTCLYTNLYLELTGGTRTANMMHGMTLKQ